MSTEIKTLGLFSYLQLPETYDFVSLHSADGFIELLLFVHNEVVTLPNRKRKIIADVQNVNDGEYYTIHFHWQAKGGTGQRFATASAFVRDNPTQDGCEIIGFAELTPAIPLFGLILFVIALGIHLMTGVGWIAFGVAFIAYVLATRGALKWRNSLIKQIFNTAQIIPQQHWESDSHAEEFDERIDQLVKGIQQGK